MGEGLRRRMEASSPSHTTLGSPQHLLGRAARGGTPPGSCLNLPAAETRGWNLLNQTAG